jgi:hypothetical protein
MPSENNPKDGPKSPQHHYLPFPIRLTKAQIEKLDELAGIKKVNRSDLAREAIQFYLENLEVEQADRLLTKVEKRLQMMDQRWRALLIKSMTLAGQNLYFSTLPYVKGGLPKQPLSQPSFDKQFAISRAFAYQFLKSKQALSRDDIDQLMEPKESAVEPQPENK